MFCGGERTLFWRDGVMADEVRAKRFLVVDDDGNERAILGASGNGVALEFRLADADQPSVALQLSDSGEAHLALTRGDHTAEIKLGKQGASVKLTHNAEPKSSCGLTLDHTGAWVVAEATHDIGIRLLCRADETASSVWLSETFSDDGEPCVRTRYLRPDPAEDKTAGWRSNR